MRPRVIFMGTPEFAVPAMERLVASDLCDLSLVVTQPDRRAGRGKKLVSPPVKIASDALDVPTLQTDSLRHREVRQRIIDLEPDLIVVAAFGMILGKWILELPARGCVNLHASLLPKYRGANPIATAIAEGESVTGITLMQMDRGLDTGAMYASSQIAIDDADTTESLTPKLAMLAADLLEANLAGLLSGSLPATPQGTGASLTRMMTKDDGWIDFRRSAVQIERQVRAMWPWPRTWTIGPDSSRMQIHHVDVADEDVSEPGTIMRRDNEVLIGTGSGSVILRRIQLPGGKPIEGTAILNSGHLTEGGEIGAAGGTLDLPPLVVPVP